MFRLDAISALIQKECFASLLPLSSSTVPDVRKGRPTSSFDHPCTMTRNVAYLPQSPLPPPDQSCLGPVFFSQRVASRVIAETQQETIVSINDIP